jgi:Leucine-rich repeat (LRR) protein
MAQLKQRSWAHFLGDVSSFALSVAPYLSNKELFALSACSRKLLRLRYDLCRFRIKLNKKSYMGFRTKRHSVPPCFEGSFDLMTYLGSRLSVRMRTKDKVENVDALAGVHTLDLRGCKGLRGVSALGGVHTLDLSNCQLITDVGALGGVNTLNLSNCQLITYVGALGGVNTLNLSNCQLITDVGALGDV